MDKKKTEHIVDYVFRGEKGEEFDKLLQQICLVNASVYSGDALKMAYMAGKRDVYLLLKSMQKGGINGREYK